MCGRYRLTRKDKAFAQHFDAEPFDGKWQPRYNIAPTQPVPVVRQDREQPVRHVSLMRWGLVPSWATDPSISARMINARSETVASKPAFREPLQKQRCLVPADGFYEWWRSAGGKQPFCFEVGEGELFAFAGLWDRWRGPDGNVLESCTILTTTPNQLLADVHDRMPVILSPDDYDLWLDPGMRNAATAADLLKPFDATMVRRYPVSARVNTVVNDDPECSAPADAAPSTASLFD